MVALRAGGSRSGASEPSPLAGDSAGEGASRRGEAEAAPDVTPTRDAPPSPERDPPARNASLISFPEPLT